MLVNFPLFRISVHLDSQIWAPFLWPREKTSWKSNKEKLYTALLVLYTFYTVSNTKSQSLLRMLSVNQLGENFKEKIWDSINGIFNFFLCVSLKLIISPFNMTFFLFNIGRVCLRTEHRTEIQIIFIGSLTHVRHFTTMCPQ